MQAAPFSPESTIAVVLPSRFDGLADADRESLRAIAPIFEQSRAALERELGAPFQFVERDPGCGARWLIGPAVCNPDLARIISAAADGPELFLDRVGQLLICDAPTPGEVWETFSWLRTLARFPGGRLAIRDCANIAEAIERIAEEVGDSYPAFMLRGLDWQAICAAYRERFQAPDPVPALQEWLAELHDTHTWVRPSATLGRLPYEVWVTPHAALFAEVPQQSAAWQAGVRPGFQLLQEDPAHWWQRTAATPHARPLVAGRRMLSGPIGGCRILHAQSPTGRRIRWSETIPSEPWDALVSWRTLPSGAGYLRIRAWIKGAELEAAVDAALADLGHSDHLIVDLRGNGGGDLTLAQRFRDRFLRSAAVLGTIRTSTGHRKLSEPEPIRGEPAPERQRWRGRVRFLTDPLTYSASEDALLGLQGLSHVEVFGEPSGGGSGRPRSLRLLPGWQLTISTALTFDRYGRCVEGAGIPVDRPVAPDRFRSDAEDSALRAADNW